jgi:8-oxo-dGTP pyrophosphatase MutT (NUDIX family)
MTSSLRRHIDAVHNTTLPDGRLRFHFAGSAVGYVSPECAATLCLPQDAAGVHCPDQAALDATVARRRAAGMWWRGEAFDIRATPEGPVLGTIDRGSLPVFGIAAAGVHMNGLVARPEGPHLWIARRAANKKLDPNKLDHMVAGGVSAGHDPRSTLIKEAAEEAALPAALARRAQFTARISYAMRRPEGLRRDVLYCYDLWLPADFTPVPADGEVAGFECWPLPRVLRAVRETDDFKFNVSLVLIDLFLRHGMIAAPEAGMLRAALDRAPG